MDVEQWWNNPERFKQKNSEETFINMTCSTTYSTSTRLVLGWATAWRVSGQSCGVAVKNRFNCSHLLAIQRVFQWKEQDVVIVKNIK